jgi:arginyl-tRNA synthetase
MNIKYLIKKDIEQALIKINSNYTYEVFIISSKKIELGHYQVDNLMKISSRLKIKPYKLFQKILILIEKKKIYKK